MTGPATGTSQRAEARHGARGDGFGAPPGRAPSPRGGLLLGHVPAFRAAPIDFCAEAFARHGDVVRLRAGVYTAFLIRHPDDVEKVLVSGRSNFPKRTKALDRLGVLLGEGLVSSDGELWKRQRRTIQPWFRPDRLEAYADTMVDETESVLTAWASRPSGEPFDVTHDMMGLAFRIVARALLGADLSEETDGVRRAVDTLQAQTNERIFASMSWPLWIPTRANREFREAVDALDEIVYRLIEAARGDPNGSVGVLHELIAALSDDRDAKPEKMIRDELVTLLLAGHENTGNLLTWMWYLIARHPEVEERLHAELDDRLSGRRPTASDLPRLPYARSIVLEALRLYPTSWITLRMTRDDDVLGGYAIPGGSWIVISPYLVHRHPDFWSEPHAFEPDRFAPESSEGRHRHAYMPFSAGSRKCIGNHFALMEATLSLATIASRYRVVPAFDHELVPRPLVSLPPDGPVLVTVEARR
ncbi:MAG TPA: cytochrome P450 [Longimicrobiales bacterium]|nr:cytochrome P450 [Longimicrobiales bacterium]